MEDLANRSWAQSIAPICRHTASRLVVRGLLHRSEVPRLRRGRVHRQGQGSTAGGRGVLGQDADAAGPDEMAGAGKGASSVRYRIARDCGQGNQWTLVVSLQVALTGRSIRLATAGHFRPPFHSGPCVPSRRSRLSFNVGAHKCAHLSPPASWPSASRSLHTPRPAVAQTRRARLPTLKPLRSFGGSPSSSRGQSHTTIPSFSARQWTKRFR